MPSSWTASSGRWQRTPNSVSAIAEYQAKAPEYGFEVDAVPWGGFEFGGAFAITNPEPVLLSDAEYQEMIAALRAKLGM